MAVGLVLNGSMMANSNNAHNAYNIYDRSRFSLNLPNAVSHLVSPTQTSATPTSSSMTTNRLRHWDMSPTSPNDQSPFENSPSSMLASPAMNMPTLCRTYNPYSPVAAHQAVSNMGGNMQHHPMAASPNSSTYSASPVNSPQQHVTQEELVMRYNAVMRQQQHPMAAAGFPPQPPMQPSSEYAYFYNEYGMKRRKRDFELSPGELEKRRVRRERNKQAALRCRTRRRERIDALEEETTQIEEDNNRVEKEVRDLQKQIEELHALLKEHDCPKQLPYSGGNV